MSTKQGRKIAIVGGSGSIGSHTLSALLKTNIHTVTAISRSESNATFPAGVIVKKGDYSDESFLVSALEGQDILILQLGIFSVDQQTPLIRAAAKAGVPYVLPTEFGSDPYSPLAKNFPMLIERKKKYRDLVEELGLSWIAVVNNPWFDWSLKHGNWGINIKEKKATLYKGAEGKLNTTTQRKVGEGVSKLLSLPDAELETFKNKPVYLSSFEINQREVLDSAIRVTGTKESDWKVVVRDADEVIAEARKEVAQGNHMAHIMEFYITHMKESSGGNYQAKATKDAEVLGLKDEEDLDDVVKAVVDDITTEN
ncbi:NAD(P)-binding protein [Cucurbitaria berberidis CBS 394.84]|uniref:NAD(P)-binding protein n=1 Tax=Cucurbitaria berberidis CBS 394.84 TaxID=1168544 RepID=A0A9P4GM39_9PLEO|nr:NAD(P)-binding protein [Cucurbitaria berberidis CBS 394.84]KAF1847704.1 NAD(P)-binding protein [Cucurbitaria berberidis CBS 394.84]